MNAQSYSHMRCFVVLLLAVLCVAPFSAFAEQKYSDVSIVEAPLGVFQPRDESVLYIMRKLGLPTSWEAEEANNSDPYYDTYISDDYAVADQYSAPYMVITESSLEQVDTWTFEDMTGELFAGKGGGYLAILRKGDSVICAEYVNGYMPEIVSDGVIMLPADCFRHTLLHIVTNVLWMKTETAYFIDGSCCQIVYDSPTDKTGIISLTDTFSSNCPNILATHHAPEVN